LKGGRSPAERRGVELFASINLVRGEEGETEGGVSPKELLYKRKL